MPSVVHHHSVRTLNACHHSPYHPRMSSCSPPQHNTSDMKSIATLSFRYGICKVDSKQGHDSRCGSSKRSSKNIHHQKNTPWCAVQPRRHVPPCQMRSLAKGLGPRPRQVPCQMSSRMPPCQMRSLAKGLGPRSRQDLVPGAEPAMSLLQEGRRVEPYSASRS